MATESTIQLDDSSVVATLACPTAQFYTNQNLGHIQFIPVGQSIHFDRRIYLEDPHSRIAIGNYLGLYEPQIANYRWAANYYNRYADPREQVLLALRENMVNIEELDGQGYHAIAFPNLGFEGNNELIFGGHPNYVVFHPEKGYVPIFAVKLPKEQVAVLGAYYNYLLGQMGLNSTISASLHHNPVLGWRTVEHTYKSGKKAMIEVLREAVKIAREPNHFPYPVLKPKICERCPEYTVNCFTGAPDEYDLTTIKPIGAELQLALIGIGINSVDQLAHEDIDNLKLSLGERLFKGLRRTRLRKLQKLAQAQQRQQIDIVKPIKPVNRRFEIHFDDETFFDYDDQGNPYPRIFHNGAWFYDNNTKKGEYIYRIAEHIGLRQMDEYYNEYMNEAELLALRTFWAELSKMTGGFSNTVIYHYGAHDNWTTKSAVKRLMSADEIGEHPFFSGKPKIIDALNKIIRPSVYSPWGHSMKVLTSRHFQYPWRVEVLGKSYNATSSFATKMYRNLLSSQGYAIADAYRNAMIEYNRADCTGLFDLIHNLTTAQGVRVAY